MWRARDGEENWHVNISERRRGARTELYENEWRTRGIPPHDQELNVDEGSGVDDGTFPVVRNGRDGSLANGVSGRKAGLYCEHDKE